MLIRRYSCAVYSNSVCAQNNTAKTMKSKKQSESLIAAERNGVKSETKEPAPPKPLKKGERVIFLLVYFYTLP